MAKCKSCDQETPDNVNFCPNCGANTGRSEKGSVIVTCGTCDGQGWCNWLGFSGKLCPTCGGKGKVRV